MMRILLLLVMIMSAATLRVVAAPSSQVAWTPETMQLLAAGDPGQGKAIHTSEGCAGCHGEQGMSSNPAWPHLGGQLADYTYKQLRDYQDGTRVNGIMQGMLGGLDDQTMADLAVFYASLSLPSAQETGVDISVAETLVRKGDGKRLIPACAACHKAPQKRKHHGMPLLEGQNPEYFKITMQAYKTGDRANDVYSVMRNIASQLTSEEIEALAAYYAARGSQP